MLSADGQAQRADDAPSISAASHGVFMTSTTQPISQTYSSPECMACWQHIGAPIMGDNGMEDYTAFMAVI